MPSSRTRLVVWRRAALAGGASFSDRALVGRSQAAAFSNANPYRSRASGHLRRKLHGRRIGQNAACPVHRPSRRGRRSRAWFLSRGYGGRLEGPLRVDPAISIRQRRRRRRAAAACALRRRRSSRATAAKAPKRSRAAASENAVIIMDDGLQNPALGKDLAIAVIVRDRGFGNGHVIPAGPLRAPLDVTDRRLQT